MKRGPLADSYPAAAALVVCALVPYLALTASLAPLTPVVGKAVGLSRGALELTIGMSDAGYAIGTVIAVQLAQRLPPRRMLIAYVTAFVVFAVLAAAAPSSGAFVAGLVGEGLCTSLMLIAAVPPLVTGFGAEKTPVTGVIMNLCIFGAVAAGPSIGGLEAGAHSWHPLFWTVAGVGAVALVLALLTFEEQEPQDTSVRWDAVPLALAGGGCAAAFFGASELELHRHASALALATLFAGLAAVVALIVHQYATDEPLMPVRQLATTFPVTGIAIALAASAAAFGLMNLAQTALARRDPSHVAVLFLPELGAAVLTAAIFGALFRTRFTPPYAATGLVVLAAAAAVLAGVAHGSDVRVLAGSGLLGLGVGAAVSPGLFIAGFSLRAKEIQRVFALIELLRGVTAFLVAPVLLYLAASIGLRAGIWICLGIAAVGVVAAAAIFLLGGARLQVPDLERWQEEGEPAWDSPPLLSRGQQAKEPEREHPRRDRERQLA